MFRIILRFALTGLLAALTAPAIAQGVETKPAPAEQQEENWYYQQPTNYRPDSRTIIQEKAQIRAQQRQARMASMSWYGMSNSRPTASPTPFATMYSPAWRSPGGQPFAWYASHRPTYIFYTR